MTTMKSTGESSVLSVRSVPGVQDAGELRDWAAELVDRARAEGVELTGDDGLLTALVRQVLQTGLEVEMTDHLGYERHDPAGRGSGNSRNGHYPRRSRPRSARSTYGCRGTAAAASSRGPSARRSISVAARWGCALPNSPLTGSRQRRQSGRLACWRAPEAPVLGRRRLTTCYGVGSVVEAGGTWGRGRCFISPAGRSGSPRRRSGSGSLVRCC